MSYTRRRPPSPSSRRLVDPMRASTGNMPVVSTGPYHVPPRGDYEDFPVPSSPRALWDRTPEPPYRSNYRPEPSSSLRPSGDRNLEVQPISSKTYRDPGNSAKSRTEYALRPRSNTDAGRRPLSVIVPSSTNRQSPIVESGYERPRSPLPKAYYDSEDTDPYILPATSSRGRHHHRAHGADEGDPSRLAPSDKESRARAGYRSSGGGASKGYPASGSLVKYRDRDRDFDDYDAYSYTNPEEQFDRDSVAGQQSRRAAYGRKERPRSMTGLDGYRPQLEGRPGPRELGPPPSSRGLDRLRPDDGYRPSGRVPLPPHRIPVSLHKAGDDGYSSYHEEYDDFRDIPRSRRHYGDPRGSRPHPKGSRDDRFHEHGHASDSGRKSTGGLVSDGSGADPTTGYPRDLRGQKYDYDSSKLDRRTARKPDHDYVRGHEARTHGHRREGTRRYTSDSDADDYSTDEDHRKYTRRPTRRHDPESTPDKPKPKDESRRLRDSEHEDSDSRRQARRGRKALSDEEDVSDSRLEIPEDREWKGHTAERGTSREPDTPPKGILKPPREKFPEDKNAVREGVAPLKDATNKGIPPGARWTKIDRKLVNPAALEAKQERFEERLDYVIVLRVLTREEIQSFADKTQEIREARYEAERRERRRRQDRDRGHSRSHDHDGSDGDTSSEDDDDDEDTKTPLAIEEPSGSRRQLPTETRPRTDREHTPDPDSRR